MAQLPEAGSPEAERRGTTWDHRAAALCMSHVLSFCETDGGDISGGDIQTGRHPRLQQAGDGGGRAKPSDILDSGRWRLPVRRRRHLSGETRKRGLLPLTSAYAKHDQSSSVIATDF